MFEVNSTINAFAHKLEQSGISNAKAEVYILCAELINKTRSNLITCNHFSKKEYSILKKAVNKRAKHIPLQLILKKSPFLNVEILENKNTLKPRPETELLASIVLKNHPQRARVLDLCCGSGSIGIALAKNGHNVTAADVSSKAVKQTKINAKHNGVLVKVIKSNMFKKLNDKYDIIISNPPYIPTAEVPHLQIEVKKYDPILALDGGHDGLKFYLTISTEAPKFLNKGGYLYLECGKGQAQTVVSLLAQNFKNIEIIKDFNNIERFIKAELK